MMELAVSNPDFVWSPSDRVRGEANWTRLIEFAGVDDYPALLVRSVADPEWFWNTVIGFLDFRFYQPYSAVLDASAGLAFPKWCVGGTTNIVLNALDKKTATQRAAVAVVCEAEDGTLTQWTYAELDAEVCRFAAGLQALGLVKGDTVGLYMPTVAQAMVAFLGILKLGCIVVPLFSGFGAEAIATRLNIADAVAVVTADATTRRGQTLPMKAVIDEAVRFVHTLRHVVVLRHCGLDLALVAGRDVDWHELTAGRAASLPTVEVEAEHPALLIYTSGTTGKPKGVVHTHCGLGVKMGMDTQLCWDFKPSDRVLYLADFGWLGGPMVSIGCTLANAAFLMIEGAPDYPQACRYWRSAQDLKATIIGLAPTLARGLRRHGDAETDRYDLSRLRVIALSGEVCDSETWMWIFEHIGRRKLPLLNLSGGTEIGGIASANILLPLKAGCLHGAIPGTGADIVDDAGRSVAPGEIGELVMRQPCIGTTRGLWKEPDRYLESYFSQIPGLWTHGDLVSRDADGCWFMHGRSDDTIKVAGKRTGPAELEEVLLLTGLVSEAAVVGVPDAVKGSAVVCVVIPSANQPSGAVAEERLSDAIVNKMGASFRPQRFVVVSDLPRTRTMKVMRRVVRAVLTGTPTGDLSSLVNPEAVDELRRTVRAAAPQ